MIIVASDWEFANDMASSNIVCDIVSMAANPISRSKLSDASGCTGITTYIQEVLRGGVPFQPARVRRRECHHSPSPLGINIGRKTDKLFTAVVRGRVRLDPSNEHHKRCIGIFAALEKNGIKPLASQIPVYHGDIKVRTELDGIGVHHESHSIVVIEIKCTATESDAHVENYRRICRNARTLANGMPNTEQSAHIIQTVFGCVCVHRNYPDLTKYRVRGCVIVAAHDKAKFYWIQDRMISDVTLKPVSTYSITKLQQKAPTTRCKGITRSQKVSFINISTDTVANEFSRLRKFLKKQGFEDKIYPTPPSYRASCWACDATGTRWAVIGIARIRAGYKESKIRQKHHDRLKHEAKLTLNLKKRKYKTSNLIVFAYVMLIEDLRFCFERVGTPLTLLKT